MAWREFEMLIAESFRRQGFRVSETGGNGPDGGIDLVMWRGSEKFVVQCKHWKAFKVGVTVVRELYGVMAANGATGGFVVTSGRFSDDAVDFARGRNVELIDGPKLEELLRRGASTTGQPANRAGPARDEQPSRKQDAVTQGPPCPDCGKLMVRRLAKRGANQGNAFWGCSTYPSCRGTRSMT
jgi:restriction system protein